MDSKWREYDLEHLLLTILADVQSRPVAGHHFGPPYLTAYQLAFELDLRYPQVVQALGYPIGGTGIGQRNSLAQYLGRELSRRIHSGEIMSIEGGLLSDLHLKNVTFHHDGETIDSSLAGYGIDHALFRLSRA